MTTRRHTLAAIALGSAFLAACTSAPPASTPIRPEAAAGGISLLRALPEVLPDKSVPIPHSQFVLIPSESAAGLLMPVPFVAEAIAAEIDRSTAQAFETRYAGVAPYRLALKAMRDSPLFKAEGGSLTLRPFVFMTECIDDQFRFALVFQLQGGGWTGRYMAHLPTTYAVASMKNPSPEALATLGRELDAAAAQLRLLVERGAAGKLQPSGMRADIGSLHLVGGRAAGLMSPMILIAKGADVIEEGPDQVIVRLPGDMSAAGTVGGLFFGVHLLRKDQLHTFKKLPDAKPA